MLVYLRMEGLLIAMGFICFSGSVSASFSVLAINRIELGLILWFEVFSYFFFCDIGYYLSSNEIALIVRGMVIFNGIKFSGTFYST